MDSSGLSLTTSDEDDGAIAGSGLLVPFLWVEVNPAAVVVVCVVQPQQRQLPGESAALSDLLLFSYVNSACKVFSYGVLGDLSIFQGKEHNVVFAMETPAQVDPHGFIHWGGACDLHRWVDSHLSDGHGLLGNCQREMYCKCVAGYISA